MSSIWSFSSLDEHSKYAVCDDCKQKVARGGTTTKTYNTSNLVSHLKINHQELYKRFEGLKAQERQDEKPTTSAKAKQLTLEESGDHVRVWDINDPKAQRIHRVIGEMILSLSPLRRMRDSPSL